MYNHTKRSSIRRRRNLLTLAAVTLFAVPVAASPQALQQFQVQTMQQQQEQPGPGAGTMFVACTDRAWLDYNNCLVNAQSEWRKKLCDLAFQADIVWCGSVFRQRVESGT